MTPFVRYAHTNIIASDWRKLVDFYQTVFNCMPVPPERNQSGDWLSRGTGVPNAALRGMHLRLPGHGPNGPTLEIYQYQDMLEKSPAMANRKGFGHIAFEIDDVVATLEAVIENGGRALGDLTTVEVPDVGKLSFVYAADPEENILELQSWILA